MKRFLSLFLALCLLFSLIPAALADGEAIQCSTTIESCDNSVIAKYGNVSLSITVEDFFELGFSEADLVTVKFLDNELTLPVIPTYSYVDSGSPAIIAALDADGQPTGSLALAINMGNFADVYGIATKITNEDKTYYWVPQEGVTFPITVFFELSEKEGYMAEYLLHELNRTNNRTDYGNLTDAEFANFRGITTTGMGTGKLYRTSSPINPELNRSTYADKALEKAGVTVIMNLADSETEAAGYEGFDSTYYSKQNVVYLNLGVDFSEKSFQDGLAAGLRFFAENPGVYAVHCNEGKDRAGFVSALLECLMGATYEEVIADYMVTYYNYYGIEPGTDKYTAIANSNIVKTLQNAFGVKDLTTANLAAEAAEYINEIGLSSVEIAKLKVNLGAELEKDGAVILYTNDIHTYIDNSLNYATIAALKDELSYSYGSDNVLLLDAGDHAQGTAYGSMDKGQTIIDLMNAAGYDAATLGNHEFDYGMDGCMNVIKWAKFPYLSCNFYHEANGVKGESVLDSYKLFEANGKKIAIIGITTPESFTKSTPAYFQDEHGNYIYGIAGGTNGSALYADVQTAINAATADGADYIIALGHLGIDTSSQPCTSEDVIANTTGLNAFIDGHSHNKVEHKEVLDKAGKTVVLTQTGSYFGAIGKMTIADDGTISTELITDYKLEDADVKAIQDKWISNVDTQLGAVIGHADVTFNNYDAAGNRLVRKQETNTGDFAADALYYLFDNMDLDVDVAIMNGGGVRNKAVTDDLTYKTCKEIHTFGNVACLQTITGQQLLDALEWGARDVGSAECGGFLQVSGLTYEIHTYINSTVQKDDKGVWTGGPTGEYRVKNVQILNKETGRYEPLDLTAKYNLAGYNYTLRDLGDGFAMFDGAVNVLDYVMEDYMVLANYVQSFPKINGLPTITAENSPYGEVTGEGRITIVSEKPAEPVVPVQPSKPSQPAAPAVSYTDVQGHWAADAIEYVTEASLMNGVGNGKFAPDAALSRGMLATILYRLAGEPAVSGKATASFTDCENGVWYSDAVVWAAKNGIIKGYTDGAFLPNQPVTRQEMAVIIYRYAVQIKGAKPVSDPLTYADASSIADWAVEGVAYCTANKILQGSNNYFRPAATATRAEVAQVFANLSKR